MPAKLRWAFDFQVAEGKSLEWKELKSFLLVEKKPHMVTIKLRYLQCIVVILK